MYEKGIAEKLYLQLDKPYYSAGENIWKITGYAAAFDPLVITAVCGEYSVTAQTALTT